MGIVHQQAREEIFTSNKERFLANIKASLSGYIAEKIKLNTTSDGCASDFKHAMQLAHNMVWRLGMGPKHLGDFYAVPEQNLSEKIKEELNEETEQILQACLKETEVLLRQEIVLLDRFASELLEKEELEYDEIDAIFKEYHKSKFGFSENPSS